MTTPISNNGGTNNFDEILDRCLRAVESGQMSIEQCAARYPNYPELAGLLRMAIAVRDLPRPQMPAGAAMQMQRRLQVQLRERVRASAPRRSGLASFPLRRLLLTVAVMLVILFVGGVGLVFASADKLPGDGFLYSVKRNVEGLRLSFASQTDRPNVLYDIAETRLNEIRGLAARSRAVSDTPVNDMYDSVSLAVGSLSDNAKKVQLTTDAESALQDALNRGMVNSALAQLTTQKLQIELNIFVPNLPPTGTPTPGIAVQPTTTTPPAEPSATPTATDVPTEAATMTLTPSFTASSTDTKAVSTATQSATRTFTPSATPTSTVPAPVLGPSYTPTLGRGPAVTVVGVATKTPTLTQTAAESQTAEASVSASDTPTEAATEEATQASTEQATATITDTETPTATETPTFTPTATSTPSPTRTPKPPTATPTATFTQTATPVPTANGLPSANLKQSPQEITFHDCKPEGNGGDPALNQLRNRVDEASQYPQTAFDSIAKFPWPKDAEGKSRDQWSPEMRNAVAQAEGLPVMVEGYLVKVQENGPESQNCNSTYHTWQLWLLGNPGSPNDLAKALIAGISPRVAANHAGWTLDKLTALAASGAKIRISGWLMFNEDQAGEVGKSRVSLWEIHPMMQIGVAKGNQWVNLDDFQS